MKKRLNCEVDCANCANKVESALKKIDGIKDASINFMTQKVVLDIDDEKDADEIIKLCKKEAKKIESDFEMY